MDGQNQPKANQMTYLEQLDIIKSIPLKEGDRKILTCPFCGGRKKLSITKADGQLKWNCFRASCNGKGIYSGRRSLEAAKSYIANQPNKLTTRIKPVPKITTSVYNHQPAVDYLEQVNSLEALECGYIDIRYAPAEDRVLFYGPTGAVGRSLSRQPKWISYGELPVGISVGKGSTIVLVEDTPSACSISRVNGLVGYSLLGTKITHNIKIQLKKYSSVYLVLDKDASKKAIEQTRNVDKGIKVRFTSDDLKHQTEEQIKCLIQQLTIDDTER